MLLQFTHTHTHTHTQTNKQQWPQNIIKNEKPQWSTCTTKVENWLIFTLTVVSQCESHVVQELCNAYQVKKHCNEVLLHQNSNPCTIQKDIYNTTLKPYWNNHKTLWFYASNQQFSCEPIFLRKKVVECYCVPDYWVINLLCTWEVNVNRKLMSKYSLSYEVFNIPIPAKLVCQVKTSTSNKSKHLTLECLLY